MSGIDSALSNYQGKKQRRKRGHEGEKRKGGGRKRKRNEEGKGGGTEEGEEVRKTAPLRLWLFSATCTMIYESPPLLAFSTLIFQRVFLSLSMPSTLPLSFKSQHLQSLRGCSC